MALHSSTLAWKIPWMEEPGGLQSMGSLGVGHDWTTSLSLSCIGEGNSNPLQCSCLENPRDRGAWWAAVYGVAQSQTRLKQLSSSSSSSRHIDKILGKKLSQGDGRIYSENWKILRKRIKDNTKKLKDTLCSCFGRINIVKMVILVILPKDIYIFNTILIKNTYDNLHKTRIILGVIE